MCGIYGAINTNKDMLFHEKCLDTMIHRGPNDKGLYTYKNIILGHRRLSILDISSNGKQPMESIDGRYVISFNGEIYNYIELKNELIAKGYSFRTGTDTEVILASYDAWGQDCQNKFNGMWAFAILDKKKEELFLSRDRFGVKPLLYTSCGKSFVFASEMKAIIPNLDNNVTVNSKYLNKEKAFDYAGTRESIINEIKRLPAGHSITLKKDGSFSIHRWWCTLDNLISVPKRYDEQVELLRELFLDSCRIRMRSDVTIGTALSGGLDSTATICAMNKIAHDSNGDDFNRDWQHAFVATFPNTTLDESEYARAVTDYLGIPSTFVTVDAPSSIDEIAKAYYLFEDYYITSPFPMLTTYKAVRDNGVTVTLDGHGADEMFGGYEFDFQTALADCGLNYKKANMVFNAIYDSYPHDGSNRDKGVQNNYKLWSKELLKPMYHKLTKRNIYKNVIDNKHPNWENLSNFDKRLYQETHSTTLPTLLRNYDLYSMANSVEIRMPFLDYRIVQLAFSINWESKLRNGYSKSIIRDMMAPFAPEKVVKRKTKIGFNTPIVEWMQGPMKEFFEDTVNSSDFNSCDLINPLEVRDNIMSIINNGDNVTYNNAQNAYSMISPYLWEKYFLNKTKTF